MGVPTIGGQISGAVTEGSGLIVTGDLDDVGFATGNTDDVWSISVAATYGLATIDPATGTWSYDLNDSHPAVQALGLGDTLTDVFTVLMVDADGRSDTQVVTITISGAPCFVAGTPILTENGERPVEELRAGDRVATLDHGFQPLVWVGERVLSAAELRAAPRRLPVRIAAGALGEGLPQSDLYLSPQHRVLLNGAGVEARFGAAEVLCAATRLRGWPGIERVDAPDGVRYVHLLFARHELVFAAGAVSESLYLGEEAEALFGDDLKNAPEVVRSARGMAPARPIIKGGREIGAMIDEGGRELQRACLPA